MLAARLEYARDAPDLVARAAALVGLAVTHRYSANLFDQKFVELKPSAATDAATKEEKAILRRLRLGATPGMK